MPKGVKGFIKGDPNINREGKPVGTRSFTSDFDSVIEEIAKANNITNSEARKILIKKAYNEAKDGNFQYYKDLVERVYGKMPDKLDLEANLKTIIINKSGENSNDQSTKSS